MIQLQHIAGIAHNPEISNLVLKVAAEIQAEIDRLEGGQTVTDLQVPMPPQG